jgi:Glycosyl transferase family 41
MGGTLPARRAQGPLLVCEHTRSVAQASTPALFPQTCIVTDRKREDDEFSERYKNIAVAWQDISDLDDSAVASKIAEDRVDILFDLSGHTAGNRLGVFAGRAAPIQLGWAGYVGTVGLDTYDGIIADPIEIPPQDDPFYVEQVIRLPDCYVCYHPPIDPPDVAPFHAQAGNILRLEVLTGRPKSTRKSAEPGHEF